MTTRRARSSSRWHLPAASIFALVITIPSRVEAAGGAFVVDDAEIEETNTCHVESWVSFARNNDFVGVSSPACTVDLIRPVEWSLQLQRSRAGGAWTSSIIPQAKTIFQPVETGKVGYGLSVGAMLDPINNQHTGSYAYVPATWQIVEQFRINANLGWRHDRSADLHWLTWGAGFEWEVVKPITLIAEVFGELGHRPPHERSLADPRMQAGVRVTPVDKVDIDVIYGHNITGERTQWLTVGLNIRFSP
jgi:hypothetical protein